MGESVPGDKLPTIFISYAHESEALRSSVKDLVHWLENRGCRVLSDHAYQYRPPDVGWQAWMHGCIDKAETVLVVCTPRLKLRYEKNEEPDTGRGATFEGAIITQHLYGNAMRNTKFFPVLHDSDGREADIPTTLMPWWNGHRFPSGNEGILRMIRSDSVLPVEPTEMPDAGPLGNDSPWTVDRPHKDKTIEVLRNDPLFFKKLQREFPKYFRSSLVPETEAAMVAFFAQCETEEQVLNLFCLVRRALGAPERERHEPAAERRREEAATYLYCLAACRLVNQASHQARVAEWGGNHYIVAVPRDENVVCAIIAAALFGGELCLVPGKPDSLPCGKRLFEVKAPEGSDQLESDFEWEAYDAVFPNAKTTSDRSLDKGSGRMLTVDQRESLKARIRTFKKKEFSSVGILVRALKPVEAPDFAKAIGGFTTTYQVPVMVPETDVTAQLLGMEVSTLLAEIKEFWSELKGRSRASSSAAGEPPRPSPSSSGDPTMSLPGHTFNITSLSGGLAVTSGDHAPAQAGTGHSAYIDHAQGTDRAAFTALLQELAQEIDRLTSAKARNTLKQHFEVVQT
ncbi:MAG: toll/interleukin-1 receptor domain-containing protein, partial [Gammaproteobacteria bacterium]